MLAAWKEEAEYLTHHTTAEEREMSREVGGPKTGDERPRMWSQMETGSWGEGGRTRNRLLMGGASTGNEVMKDSRQ